MLKYINVQIYKKNGDNSNTYNALNMNSEYPSTRPIFY